MAAKLNLADVIHKTLHGSRVEPKQRWVGGRFGWAIHRFPIKGGITLTEVMLRNFSEANSLLKRFPEQGSNGPK